MVNIPTTDTSHCHKCKTPQTELEKPLKPCPKCKTAYYCSRDCRDKHSSKHKKRCVQSAVQNAESTPSSREQPGIGSSPSKDEIITNATLTLDLMETLSHCPGFVEDDYRLIQDAALRNVFEFATSTWNRYFGPCLPASKTVELITRYDEDSSRRDKGYNDLAQVALNRGLDINAWPEFDQRVYQDAVMRNMMIADMILDPTEQRRLGSVYPFPEEVRVVAQRMLS